MGSPNRVLLSDLLQRFAASGVSLKQSTYAVRASRERRCNSNNGYPNVDAEGKRGLEWDGEECRSSPPEKACVGVKIDTGHFDDERYAWYSNFH
jgi:hypothetical protein